MRQNRRRDPEIGVLPGFGIDARRGQQELTRVDKVLLAGIALKSVPFGPRLKAEEAQLAGNGVRRMILPRPPRHHRWDKRLDHMAVGNDGLARLNAQLHTLGPQPAPAFPFVDFRIDIQRREQRVKRAGGGMQHKGVVQPLVRAETRLAANVVILFMDLRRLREPGLLFVHRLGHENPRIVLVQFQQQRGRFRHHRNKLLVAYPGGVKENVVAQMADLVDHLTGVVDRPVVGAKLNDRQAERTRLVGLLRRRLADQIPQIRVVKAVVVNPANKAKRVTRGLKVNRRGARLDQRPVVVRFMVVAVEQHQIAAGEQRVGHHLVGRRRAVQHEVGFIRVEHLRREFLRMLGGPFVDQQIAQLHVGIAHVGAKYVLTEEIIELPPCRVFFEKGAVLVARTGESAVAHLHILTQGVKKGRQQVLFVTAGSSFQLQELLSFTRDDRGGAVRHLRWLLRENKHR